VLVAGSHLGPGCRFLKSDFYRPHAFPETKSSTFCHWWHGAIDWLIQKCWTGPDELYQTSCPAADEMFFRRCESFSERVANLTCQQATSALPVTCQVSLLWRNCAIFLVICKCLYTHKKSPEFPLTFSIITPAFLGRFFILFVPMETGMNTLQHTYLMAWWRHNCITSNVRKVYFIE